MAALGSIKSSTYEDSLVTLGRTVSWGLLEEQFGETYTGEAGHRCRPA
ncbi:hypothetical protein V4R08_13635 [Nitrobacter sp. NHB1]